jgi:hypothetical protein
VVLAHALDGVQRDLDALPGAQLREDDVRVRRRGRVLAEDLGLLARGLPREVARAQLVVVVQQIGVGRVLRRVLLPCALELEVEDEGVAVGGLVLGDAHVHGLGVDVEGDEADALREDLVDDDRGVVVDVDVLYAYCGDLCDDDAPERVGDGGVDADEVKVDRAVGDAPDLDCEILPLRIDMLSERIAMERTSRNLSRLHAWSSPG